MRSNKGKRRPIKPILAFGWFGGKAHHLNWLLPLLPEAHTYVEPFGGSGAVLLNRRPSPVEVHNDLYDSIGNFFHVLRQHRATLIEQLILTPFSRREYDLARQPAPRGAISDIERARRFFVIARQVRSGMVTTPTPGRWAVCLEHASRNQGIVMGQTIAKWRSAVQGLDRVAERLSRVYLEAQPAEEVVLRYDGPNTFFYVDPPYPHDSRTDGGTSYLHEMTIAQHESLAHVLNSAQARVAVSGYDCPLMRRLYPKRKWHVHAGPIKCASSTYVGGRSERQEFLWTNYETSNGGPHA